MFKQITSTVVLALCVAAIAVPALADMGEQSEGRQGAREGRQESR